jgi:formate hydrogenlyase subunit 3/multisubunit Na+/H+ antiporter MnhD subunit
VILLLVALGLIVAGGVAALLFSRWASLASACAVFGIVAGAVAGQMYAFRVLLGGEGGALALSWSVPYGAIFIAGDPLSAFFLVPVFGLSALAAVYGREYLAPFAGRKSLGFTWFAFNLLVASMAVVVVARQALLFLVAWESMSLSAYVLVTFEHEHQEVRRAGFIYLIAAHVGTACLIAMFLLLGRHAHSFDFDVIRSATLGGTGFSAVLFALGLVGFGVKAGFVPFYGWLPEAHAAAPSHVSALMSGVLIKMGVYGLCRTLLLLGHPAVWWGPALMLIGLSGALLGIVLAIYQRDLKRALAYSSVENMGLIALALGTGLWGYASGKPHIALLGTLAGLLHVWNHTLMKGMLFLGAGSVLHGCGTKDIEKLGGVVKRMPRTALAMVVGAIAIAGLPPLNGFVSEWVLYLGLIEGALAGGKGGSVALLFAVGVVSLVGGLAVLCFVRLIGIALLGEARSEAALRAHESGPSMTAPLALLAITSVAVAVAPGALLKASSRAVAQLCGSAALRGVSVSSVGSLNAALWLCLALGGLLFMAVYRRRVVTADATWGCGFSAPSPRMQYTGRSFAELSSERLFPKMLRARVAVVPPAALFPERATLSSEYSDPVTRSFYEPVLARWADRFARLRWLQQGKLHIYLVYVLVSVFIALAWTSVRTWSSR